MEIDSRNPSVNTLIKSRTTCVKRQGIFSNTSHHHHHLARLSITYELLGIIGRWQAASGKNRCGARCIRSSRAASIQGASGRAGNSSKFMGAAAWQLHLTALDSTAKISISNCSPLLLRYHQSKLSTCQLNDATWPTTSSFSSTSIGRKA